MVEFHCGKCKFKLLNPLLKLRDILIDISAKKGDVIKCYDLLSDWFNVIDTSFSDTLDEFDAVRLFVSLGFQHPHKCWKKILEKGESNNNILSKDDWIDYMYGLLPKVFKL